MMVHHQLLKYSIVMLQIIHLFESDTSWFFEILEVTFIEVINLGNDYLTFYNNKEKSRIIIFGKLVISTIWSKNRSFYTWLYYGYVYKTS